jgi:alanine racemase
MIFLDHLLQATSGTLLQAGQFTHFEAFNHDTRQLLPGELFVAVRGERGDGHDYLMDAVQRGAGGLLVEGRAVQALALEQRTLLEQASVTTIVVDDTRVALQQYARAILRRWHPTVIAVSGSVGKTSTKEAIAAVLGSSFATFKSWQNYNDLLGLPLSLGRLEERHEYAVLELGCDHPGEMQRLCDMIGPTTGVLTNASPTLLQYFGTLERLIEEYGMLLASLPDGGVAFVNGDDEYIRGLIPQSRAQVISYRPSTIQNQQASWSGIRGVLPEPENIPITSSLLGLHNFATLLSAYRVGRYCGLRPAEIQPALARLTPLPGRLKTLPGINFTTLLDDSHNAAPASVIAGLETVKALPADYRIAVLGDMTRLGEYEEEAHRLVGQAAAHCVDYLILRGEYATVVAGAARKEGFAEERIMIASTHEDAAEVARHIIRLSGGHARYNAEHIRGTIYIKGSEDARMERVTERLMAQPEQAREHLVRQTPGWKQIVVSRPSRPTWVEIDLSAIANNTRRIAEIVGPQVRILASLKADAYGHGAIKVGHTVLHNGASMLGVATVSEARPLREAGIRAPILVFGYTPPWQMREAVHLGLTITIYTLGAAQALSRAAVSLGKAVKVHVKVDTGMGRLGIRAEQLDEVVQLVQAIVDLPGLELEGVFTHFATVDSKDQSHARLQLARFRRVLQALGEKGLRPALIHAANSAALLSLPESRFDMVRPGIALYGLDPSEEVRLPEGFRPALSFKTQIALVKRVPAGECISYGCAYVTERPMTIATLPVGYADGFRRGPYNWGSVLIHGQEAPLLGRVCMDQCMVDVSHIPQARIGDEVVLIGRQGQASLTAEEVARRLGTIHYEVVSEILARVPRVD